MTSLYGKSAWGLGLYSVGPSGTLAVTQADQTLAGAARTVVGGTLVISQANQTLAATGRLSVSGALSAPQANQTLNGAGTVISGTAGSLNLIQAAQALVAAGSVTGATGSLHVVQANQTLTATAVVAQPPAHAVLNLAQNDQVLGSSGLILGWGPTPPCSSSAWEESELCSPLMWTPVLPPNWELPGVTGAWGMGKYGVSVYQPSSSSPWLPPERSTTSPTWASSTPPVSVDWEPCDG